MVLCYSAKNDKVAEVYLPRLEFGQQRYFAPVLSEDLSLDKFLYDLIWKTVEGYIPISYLDGLFDVPHPVAGMSGFIRCKELPLSIKLNSISFHS
jgi:hypothetical protein